MKFFFDDPVVVVSGDLIGVAGRIPQFQQRAEAGGSLSIMIDDLIGQDRSEPGELAAFAFKGMGLFKA